MKGNTKDTEKKGDLGEEEVEYDERIIQINRVSKKTKGGNKLGFNVMAVVGDNKGKVGIGLGRAPDVHSGVRKAITKAKKKMLKIPLQGTTIPHQITVKKGAAEIFLKPAAPGTGVIAGSAVRDVLEAAGVKDVVSKILGTRNKITNTYAIIKAFKSFKTK